MHVGKTEREREREKRKSAERKKTVVFVLMFAYRRSEKTKRPL